MLLSLWTANVWHLCSARVVQVQDFDPVPRSLSQQWRSTIFVVRNPSAFCKKLSRWMIYCTEGCPMKRQTRQQKLNQNKQNHTTKKRETPVKMAVVAKVKRWDNEKPPRSDVLLQHVVPPIGLPSAETRKPSQSPSNEYQREIPRPKGIRPQHPVFKLLPPSKVLNEGSAQGEGALSIPQITPC